MVFRHGFPPQFSAMVFRHGFPPLVRAGAVHVCVRLAFDRLSGAFEEFLDALYPRTCRLCRSPASDGEACVEHRLPSGRVQGCGRCAGVLGDGLPDGHLCPSCRRHAPPFACTVALGRYESGETLRDWVLAFKHGGRRDLAQILGAALGQVLIEPSAPTPDPELALLVPVPAHPLRRLERGYDQAALLAEAVARSTALPLCSALRRRRPTAVQGAVGSPSRRANVAGAFAPTEIAAKALAGAEVWLVDDVFTSGSTVAECARVLRRAGAARVAVACLARAG